MYLNNNTFLNSLIWKIPLVFLAFLILYFEVNAYTNTKGSIGELLLHPNQSNVFLFSSSLITILGLILVFNKSKTGTIILIGLICLVLILFYPSFDMRGVENPF
jgi:hypothetical protein